MNQSNCMVAQSGGPTAAINASLAGVISGIKKSGKYDTCYGAINGILGILNERYLNLSQMIPDEKTLNRLKVTPAMYLGSCRHKLPDYKDDDSAYVFIFNQFAKLNIKAFFYIGGNDSMDTVLKLSDYAAKIKSDIRIIGVPKTIDNDLCMIDHTPGFGSAAKYIASTMLEIAHDTFIYAVKSVTIVEIMGRDAGWLTAASALARNDYNTAPHFIYLPEVAFDKEQFLTDIRNKLKTLNNVIVAVSEGIRDKNGDYITASKAVADQFGHQHVYPVRCIVSPFRIDPEHRVRQMYGWVSRHQQMADIADIWIYIIDKVFRGRLIRMGTRKKRHRHQTGADCSFYIQSVHHHSI